MVTLQLSGIPDPRPEGSELGRGLPAGAVTVKHAARLDPARAGGTRLRLADVEADDIVEIELEDGLRLWSRVEDLQRDFAPPTRDAAGDIIELPAYLPIGGPSRGLAGWAIKGLKVIGIDVTKSIARFVADHVESKLRPGPGLYRCSEAGAERLTPARSIAATGPTLVFLHGTASSTAGSFGGLWEDASGAPVHQLFARYEGRVLALQHESLTKSPIDNAVVLVERLLDVLGKGAEVHLVSHSRGGLVGELLARGMRKGSAPFTPDDLRLFAGRKADQDALARLGRLLERAQLQVTRFVRVACPARGTTLAGGRLDRYVSILVNLASLVPGLKASAVYDGLTSLLAGVLKERTRPESLPGLEAMMPESPLVRMLNRPGVETAADLHVLGGDLEGAGIIGRLKTLVTDLYYREDHDLVVNTPAMLGGTERVAPIRYWIDTGPDVTHFHYFVRTDTASRLVAALDGGGADFHDLEVKPFQVTADDYRKRAPVAQPVVFVVPGIMGSALSVGGASIWMEVLALARGGLSRLAMDARDVKATGLVESGYAALCEYLSASHDVIPFPYDWRQSLDVVAEALRKAIDARLPQAESENQPVRLLAHSMGGLVVRAMLATRAGQATWERMCKQPGARFIMLGTPNGGSHAIAAMLMGRDALVKKLALVDLTNDHKALLETIAGFDGVLNLLPYAGTLDLYQAAGWRTLLTSDVPSERGLFGGSVASTKSAGFMWTAPAAAALTRARRIRDLVAQSPLDPSRTVYVAGVADETAVDVVVDPAAEKGRRVKVLASEYGDGRVPWSTGIPAGIRTFYMDAVHGDLASTRDAFPALSDLLGAGTTAKLATTPPQRRTAAGVTVERREPLTDMVPDREELVVSALGGRRRRPPRRGARRRVHVQVVHDNLINATSPMLVGHYENDVIVAAERVLNARLDGRLSELHRMELYPGPVGTAVAVLNADDAPEASYPGAVIAGLGTVGELTPGQLTRALAQALTTYGAECVGRERRRRQRAGQDEHGGGEIGVAVSTVLVGSGEAGVSLKDAVQAMLRGVKIANDRLRSSVEAGGGPATTPITAQIDQVRIFELLEDRAIDAVYALRNLSRSAQLDEFVLAEHLEVGPEGIRRVRGDDTSEWWQRVRVTSDNGALKFEALTNLARAEARLQPTQRRAVDGFLRRAIATTAFDPTLGTTLFELLVPNDFKTFAPDRRNLVLILDDKAATLPWELLHDRYDRAGRPLAVASGMVRQLLDSRGRDRVARAPGRTALVVGNPRVADARFHSLPGAAEEARIVGRILQDQGYEVLSLVEDAAHPMAVLTALHAEPWRVLHLAAHGIFEFELTPGEARATGLVLDDGIVLSAVEAEQMRYVPEVVFINCCHLGQTAGETRPPTAFPDLAANLATQFIRMGARAVVAAGWAVDDAAAQTFARVFYEEMFAGSPFGEAVARARDRVFTAHGATNTWGAYQCYGDPQFSLQAAKTRRAAEAFVAPAEVAVYAERVSRAARSVEGPAREGALVELKNVVGTVPEAWWRRSSSLCAAVGQAFGDLDDFAQADQYFSRMTASDRADAPMSALEQVSNLRVRHAATLAGKDPRKVREALRLLRQTETVLRNLVAIGATSERYSLLGSLYKRRAMLVRAPARRAALEEMRRAYARAFDIVRRDDPSGRAYALGNRLAAEVVLGWRGAGRRGRDDVRTGLRAYGDIAEELRRRSTAYFDLAATADWRLLSELARGALPAAASRRVREAFVHAGLRGVVPRHRASFRDQLGFYTAMSATELPRARGRDLKAALDELASAFAD